MFLCIFAEISNPMKRITLLSFIILFSIGTFAQNWNSISNVKPTAPSIELVSSNANEISVSFHLNGYFTQAVETQHGQEFIVSVPEMVSQLEAGSPDLPMASIPLIIGDLDNMEVHVAKLNYTDIEDIAIAPSKGNLSRQINPDEVPFSYGTMYGNDAFYPTEQALLDVPYILRDFRGQNVIVKPFAYNPVTKTLRVFHNMTLVMKKVNGKGYNDKIARKSNQIKVDPEMKNYYRHRFVNFAQGTAKYTFIEDRGEMLIICPDQYAEAMQPLADWKNQSGRPTTLVTLSEIGGNNDAQIKGYIQDLYHDSNLEFVLLVGDYDDLTPHYNGEGYSDCWFGQLEGNDNYIEAFVGRFSVESIADAENQVNKVIYYERDLDANQHWLDIGVGIGSTDGPGHNGGETDWQHIDYIRDTLLHYTYSEVSQRYKGVNNPTAALLTEDFNNGATICNYCNHGSETSWLVCSYNNANVNALTNDYRWPCIISTACLNGKFNHSTPCFAETWMRATNNTTGAPTGAIGGMFSWTSQAWIPPMTGQDEMNDIITEWSGNGHYSHTMGGALLNGNMRILDLHPSDDGVTHNTWILFGDPSLMLRTANPTAMNVGHEPAVLMPGLTSLNITADTEFGIATLNIDGVPVASSYITDGIAELNFEPLSGIGTAQLVVTGFNKETYLEDIEIVMLDGPYVITESYSIDGNGQLDFNETAHIDLRVKNVGVESASNVNALLSTDCQYVNIINGSTTIPNIEASGSYDINGIFSVSIADNVPDATKAQFILTCSCDGATWTSSFFANISAPKMEILDVFALNDVEPNSDGILRVVLKNSGNSDSPHGIITPSCGSGFISFTNTQTPFDGIRSGETANIDIPFHASSSAQSGWAYEIQIDAETGHYETSSTVLLYIGSIREDFETGDFSKFNWAFSGGNWSIVTDVVHNGNFAAKSAQIGNSRSSDMLTTLRVETESEISFWVRTSSELYHDQLHFYIDNTEMGVWSGLNNEWQKATFRITGGTHLLRWVYAKDASGTAGDDCVWVDDIQFPPAGIITAIPQNLIDADFTVFPNPASHTINILGTEGTYDYTLINSMGQTICQGQGRGTQTISVEDLPQGIYFVRIVSNGMVCMKKIVVWRL